MTDKKFTDEEIIKALEDYIKENEFEYFHSNIMGEYPLIRKSLDIINRQKSEIERLKLANDEKFRQWDVLAEKTKQHYADLYNEAKDILKAEAYKEFAKRLKAKSGLFCPAESSELELIEAVKLLDIDNLLKKMVGEEECEI